MEAYTTPYAIPPFDQISYDDYLPALEAGIAQKQAQVDSITANPETPTFDNTILALEQSGEILDKVAAVFFALDESNNTPEMAEIAETFYPTYSQFSDKMMMDAKLFDRVKYLYDRRDSLDLSADRKRAVESYYKAFVRNGALLSDEKKAELSAINTELSSLFLTFNKNLLNEIGRAHV